MLSLSDHSIVSAQSQGRSVRAGVPGECPKEPSFSCVSESVFGNAGTWQKWVSPTWTLPVKSGTGKQG